MCRVRFGLTGIYFDSLEPSRPREDFFQPLIASIPAVAQNKQRDAVAEAIDGAKVEEKYLVATKISKNDQDGTTKHLRDLLSSSRDEGCRLAKDTKINHASIGSKRLRNSVLSSSSSSSPSSSLSSSSASSPPSIDKDQSRKLNHRTSPQAPKPTTKSQTTQKHNSKPSKRDPSTSPEGPTKAPPAKRVRFAMDVQASIIPSDDAGSTSSSNSSDDSYTDPPSPTEPYDAFGGCYRGPGASRSRSMNEQTARWRMRIPAEVESTDYDDGFFDSEDASEVDVQDLLVKRRPPMIVQAAAKGLTPDQRNHQNNSTPLAWSKHSARALDQSRVMAGGVERNVNSGLHLEGSYAGQKRPVSSSRLVKQLRYPKLRSGENLPEPIFVVRPRFLSDAREKGKLADVLRSNSRCKRSISNSKNGRKGTKIPPFRPTGVKAPEKDKSPKYSHPSVTDDMEKSARLDEDLGMLIRDI